MYYNRPRDPEKVRQIGNFCKSVAERVTIEDAIKACCPGAMIANNGFCSCPHQAHGEDSVSKLTHCSINPAKNHKTWTCYACGNHESGGKTANEGGDAVAYVAIYNGIKPLRAAQMLNDSLGLGLIDPIGGAYDTPEESRHTQPKPLAKYTPITQATRADASTIDRVYRAVAAVCRPTPEIIDKLVTERGMTEAEIERDIISEIPSGICKQLLASGLTPEQLVGVPGVWLDATDGRSDVVTADRVNWQRQRIEYGILVRDPSGNIVGITTRYAASPNNKCRYGWYSSAKRYMGCSSGARPGYIDFTGEEWESMVIDDGDDRHDPSVAEMGKRAPIVICEGYHKAAAVHRYMHLRAMYVSGIQSTGLLPEYLSEVAEADGCRQRTIVAPDADCWTNPDIMTGTTKMIQQSVDCKSVEETRVALWNPEDGKGIDDVLLNPGRGRIYVLSLERWLHRVISRLDPLNAAWGPALSAATNLADRLGYLDTFNKSN